MFPFDDVTMIFLFAVKYVLSFSRRVRNWSLVFDHGCDTQKDSETSPNLATLTKNKLAKSESVVDMTRYTETLYQDEMEHGTLG